MSAGNTQNGVQGRRAKRSRREMLAAATGAAGLLGVTLARPTPARAGTDGDVVLGVDSQATTGTTGVMSSGTVGLHAKMTSASSFAVLGESATRGVGVSGIGGIVGVQGQGGTGVSGIGSTLSGVSGFGPTGVEGQGSTANGVHGSTGSATASGVFGENLTGTGGFGVAGRSKSPANGIGAGILGENDSTGIGVTGLADKGTGVLAVSAARIALSVRGKAVFSRSGIAKVRSGKNNVVVTMAGVSAASMVLATVQQAGGFFVQYVVPQSGAFKIVLNKAPTSPRTVKVAFFVLN